MVLVPVFFKNMKRDYRILSLDDIKELIEFWQASGLSYRPYGRDTYSNIAKQMKLSSTKFYGRFIDNKLIATAIASHNGRKGWINRLAVHPDFQHQGIASDLIIFCENWLHKNGIDIFAVLIENDNQASMDLFKKNKYIKHTDIIYYTKRKHDKV